MPVNESMTALAPQRQWRRHKVRQDDEPMSESPEIVAVLKKATAVAKNYKPAR